MLREVTGKAMITIGEGLDRVLEFPLNEMAKSYMSIDRVDGMVSPDYLVLGDFGWDGTKEGSTFWREVYNIVLHTGYCGIKDLKRDWDDLINQGRVNFEEATLIKEQAVVTKFSKRDELFIAYLEGVGELGWVTNNSTVGKLVIALLNKHESIYKN